MSSLRTTLLRTPIHAVRWVAASVCNAVSIGFPWSTAVTVTICEHNSDDLRSVCSDVPSLPCPRSGGKLWIASPMSTTPHSLLLLFASLPAALLLGSTHCKLSQHCGTIAQRTHKKSEGHNQHEFFACSRSPPSQLLMCRLQYHHQAQTAIAACTSWYQEVT